MTDYTQRRTATEMLTGSVINIVSDWGGHALYLHRANCKDGFFNFIYNWPGFLPPFVFKLDSCFIRFNIGGCRIEKPDADTIFFSDFDYYSIDDALDAVEQIEISEGYYKRHVI